MLSWITISMFSSSTAESERGGSLGAVVAVGAQIVDAESVCGAGVRTDGCGRLAAVMILVVKKTEDSNGEWMG